MVFLSPDGCVQICEVPSWSWHPSMNSIEGGHTLGCGSYDPVYTGSETGLFYFINPTPGHLKPLFHSSFDLVCEYPPILVEPFLEPDLPL